MSVKLFESKILGVSLTSLICDDGEIYFNAREIETALGYSDPSGAIQKHVSSKYKFEWCNIKGVANRDSLGEKTPQGGQFGHLQQGAQIGHLHPHTILLTGPGLYEIIFSSYLLAAVTFRDWIFSEVLPSIRKTGSYSMNGLCNTLGGMTLNVLLSGDRDQITEYKTILKAHANMLKDPTRVEMGRRGGSKCQENRKKTCRQCKGIRRGN